MLGVFDVLSHVLLGYYKQKVSVNVSFSCLLPFWVPRRQRHVVSACLKVTFAPAHTLCKYRAQFPIGRDRDTGKCTCSATPDELLLFCYYTEIYSLSVSWRINPHINSFLPSAIVILELCSPFTFSVYSQENDIKCYLQEGLNPYPGLHVFT